jgi:LysR family pca operon transcriptional activator
MNQRIKLRHLRVFVEVARRGSVIGAARGLHVSQPAVTKTIRDLEETLGVRLFRRDGRRIRITAQGEVFLHHAGTALSAVRQGVDALSRGSEGGPRIRVGALPTVSARIMPGAMQRFLRDDTGSRVRIVTGENAVLLEQLRLGELDIVLGRLAEPERMVGFFFEHLYSERVVFVVRPGHPLLASRDGPIAVCDTGIGIPEAELESIFEDFRQVDPSTSREQGGAGLGLSISRRLAEMMDAELTVASRLGHGSTFTVSFQVAGGAL